MWLVSSCINPTNVHFPVVERIIYYLNMKPRRGLLYIRGEGLSVESCVDADWARSVVDIKSILDIVYIWKKIWWCGEAKDILYVRDQVPKLAVDKNIVE